MSWAMTAGFQPPTSRIGRGTSSAAWCRSSWRRGWGPLGRPCWNVSISMNFPRNHETMGKEWERYGIVCWVRITKQDMTGETEGTTGRGKGTCQGNGANIDSLHFRDLDSGFMLMTARHWEPSSLFGPDGWRPWFPQSCSWASSNGDHGRCQELNIGVSLSLWRALQEERLDDCRRLLQDKVGMVGMVGTVGRPGITGMGWSQEGSSVHDVRTRFGKRNHLEEIWSLGGFDMGCFWWSWHILTVK